MTALRIPVRVVIPDDTANAFAESPALADLSAVADVVVHATRPSNEDELIRRIAAAEIVVSFRPAFTKFSARTIKSCTNLRFISVSGTGVEDIDVAEASNCGIAVANVVGAGNRAVAEFALGAIFNVARRITAQDRAIREGKWAPDQGMELGGKTLGLIGLSAIARELAPMASSIGMRVLSWSRNNDAVRARAYTATAVSLEDLLAQSDVISLHLRLAPELVGFMDESRFALMRRGAIFINTARGELVDERALLHALLSKRLAGAALDVFHQQPLSLDHPLRRMANVVLTPASAWNSIETSQRLVRQAIDNVLCFLAGKPINVVNPHNLASVRTI